MSCIERGQWIRRRQEHASAVESTVWVPVFCACMMAARGQFAGVHTGILAMQFRLQNDTERIGQQRSSAYVLWLVLCHRLAASFIHLSFKRKSS